MEREKMTNAMRGVTARRVVLSTLVLVTMLFAACGLDSDENLTPAVNVPGGNASLGPEATRPYGCEPCHTIPGIEGTNAYVGPPLDHWAQRSYIAGSLVNQPDNLVRWIQNPQEIEPGTAMPNLGVTEKDARDIAAYLYTLR